MAFVVRLQAKLPVLFDIYCVMSEGIIKFSCNWQHSEPLPSTQIENLNRWRQVLYNKGLIGIDGQGIGYGNISQRLNDGEFIITGSATGVIKTLTNQHYTIVTKSDVCRNVVFAKGPIIASSESMTHAVLYSCSPDINSVVHVHNQQLWKQLIDVVPTTSSSVEYGTPQMAAEMQRLYETSELPYSKILVMGGHQDGIVSFGKTPDEACSIIFKYLEVCKGSK